MAETFDRATVAATLAALIRQLGIQDDVLKLLGGSRLYPTSTEESGELSPMDQEARENWRALIRKKPRTRVRRRIAKKNRDE